ncbi:MAG TPA: hypothetical protein VK660_01815 [Xanthomonadaceae bacterium]|nr:hypothetical protein [Xanthomonadaceae bacterium]
MLDFRTAQVFGLLLRTLPFVLLRLAVYIGITVAYVVAVGIGSGFGYVAGKVGGNGAGGAGWGGFIGFAIVSGLLFWAREYLLYMVKAGHIAVLVELMDGRTIPGGKSQIDYGTSIVKQNFATSSMLFGLNQLLRGILQAFNRVTVSIASWLPIPGLDALVKLVDAIINTALSHLDQVILAQILRASSKAGPANAVNPGSSNPGAVNSGAVNPWAVARDSVVLYAQNYKGVLKNAAFLTLAIWVLTLLIFIVVFAPIAALVGLFHVHAGIWPFALTLIAALSLKAALIDPFAMVALLQVYDKVTAGQTPNPEWIAKLEGISSKFRELTQKANDAVTQPMPAR